MVGGHSDKRPAGEVESLPAAGCTTHLCDIQGHPLAAALPCKQALLAAIYRQLQRAVQVAACVAVWAGSWAGLGAWWVA